MILLSGHSLTQERRVPMEALSLQLKERDSTASMVPTDMTGINAESWFLDDVSPGGGIVYRVSGIQTSYTVATITVKLEHVINTLRDKVIFGEITPADITGNPNAERCSAEQAVRFILADQSDWRLGTFGYNVSDPYKFDGETLYDALVKISNSLEDCWWSYDMSQYPFVLNMTPKPAGVACELRPGRNLSAITKNVDKSGMYTRFYPVGKDDLHIPGEYVSRNEHLYGTVSKIEVDQSIDDPAELYEWAVERLKKHAEPNVNITADGIELADATGETLDRLTLGRICRIPLTEFDTIIEERIVGLDYSDKVHQPEKVRITMSNQKDDAQHDLVHVLASNIKATSKGQRTSTRQQKNDHAWIEDTNDHVALCAEGIVGVDANGKPNWYLLSQIVVDGTGIHQSVQEIQKDNVLRDTRIEQNQKSIILEANEREKGQAALSSRITVEADRITQEVEDRKSADKSVIVQTSTMISLSVASGQSSLYKSVIEVTSTNISMAVASGQSSLYTSVINVTSTSISMAVASGQSSLYKSVIQVTSTNIYLGVAAGQSSLYTSVINVTSTSISMAVASGQSSLYKSVIQVTSTNIYLGVAAGQSSLYTSVINVTSTAITMAVASGNSSLYKSVIQVTSTNIYLGVAAGQSSLYTSVINVTSTNIYLGVAAGQSSLYTSVINVTSTNISLSVASAKSDLSSSIKVQADKIALVVDSNNNIKASQIVQSINNAGSSVLVDAGHIQIGQNKNLSSVLGVNTVNGYAYFIGQVAFFDSNQSVSSMINLNNGKVDAPTIQVANGGHLKFGAGGQNYLDIQYADMASAIKSATLSADGKTLTLTTFNGDTVNFPKAITWSMGWDGGKFTATANPQSDSAWTSIIQSTTTWNGNLAYVPIEATDSDNPSYQYSTGRVVLVDATARYNAGYSWAVNHANVVQSWNSTYNNGVKVTVDNVDRGTYPLGYQFAQQSDGKYYLQMQSNGVFVPGTGTEIRLGRRGNAIQIQDATNSQFSGTPTKWLHEPPTITENATYDVDTLDSNYYLGFGTFTVAVDTEASSYAFSSLGVQPNQGMPPTGYTYAGHVNRPSVNSFLVFEVKANNSQSKKKYYFEIG